MPAADQQLLRESLAGHEDAFTEQYRRRQGAIYRFALQMTGSVAIAEDVTQETFLALMTRGSRYDADRGTVAAFLYGIARNHVLKRLYDQNAGERPGSGADDVEDDFDLLDDLTRRESIEGVRRAVVSLPP